MNDTSVPTIPWFRVTPPWNCGDEADNTGAVSRATAMAITAPSSLADYLDEVPGTNPGARRYFLPADAPVGAG